MQIPSLYLYLLLFLAFLALCIFISFGKKVLGKMEVQSLLFIKFIEHAKKDSGK